MNKKYILFLFVIMFCSILQTRALQAEVDIECPDLVLAGEMINCPVVLKNSDEKIYGIKFKYNLEDKLSFVEFKTLNNELVYINDYEGFVATYLDGIESNFVIGNLQLITSSDIESNVIYNVELKDINASNGEEDYYTNSVKSFKIIGITDVVASLKVNGKDLTIKNGVNNYDIVLEQSKKLVIDSTLKEGYEFVENYGPRVIEQANDKNYYLKIKTSDDSILTLNFNIKSEDKSMSNPQTGFKLSKLINVILIFSILAISVIFIYNKNYKEGR